MNNRIQELLDLAAEEGIKLPYPPEAIIALEDDGAMVDLQTGVILLGGVDSRRLAPSLLGVAMIAAITAEDGGQQQRDSKGRFICGNAWARVGWAALVVRRFHGDVAAAKAWLGRLGVWAYGQQCLNPYWQVKPCFQVHPGTPECFIERWQASFEFALADMRELAF